MQRASKIVGLFAVAVSLIVAPIPALAYEPATIAQLDQMLAAAHGKPDKDLAKQLGDLELTERLSTLHLEKLKATMPGEKSRQALLILSDLSAFHDLPAAEIPALAAPEGDTQSEIFRRAGDYVRNVLHGLIDIIVSRDTASFDNLKIVSFRDSGVPPAARTRKTVTEAVAKAEGRVVQSVASAVVENQPYHLVETASEIVTYSNGAEEGAGKKDPKAPPSPPPPGIANWGVFGPLLEIVVNDIAGGKAEWGHWEQGRQGTLAVFRYEVPQDQSNYELQYCCFSSYGDWKNLKETDIWNVYENLPSYHGEIAVDPQTGAILRLTLQTDAPADYPLDRADILVEYGPVELGGKEYILPAKSVTISSAPVPVRVNESNCADFHCTPAAFVHPKDTTVSDTVYTSYHVFRAESRILPGAVTEAPPSFQPQNNVPRKHQP